MLGAKIGSGARISAECDIAEFDLVEVGDKASVEAATLRGFGVDNGVRPHEQSLCRFSIAMA